MTAERFRPEHLDEIELQPAQLPARARFTPEYLRRIAANPAGTLRDSSGRILAIGGAVDFEDGSLMWSFLAADAGRNMVSVVRAAKRVLEVAKRPTYATAACGFEPGCRLLRMLGFVQWPDPLPASGADGGDEFVFERVQ